MDDPDPCAALVRERDLDRYLATLYAPPARRAGLFALHALDLELAEVVKTTTEPMLGQIRLAWWREQLQAIDGGARPAHPVLAALATHVVSAGISGASLEPLEDAGLALLDDDIDSHAEARAVLFEAALRLLVAAPDSGLVERAKAIGTGWAIVALARTGHAVDGAMFDKAERLLKPVAVPAAVRPLLALGALARRDLAALRRGAAPGARGTPGRQARLLWSIMTGR